MKKKLRFFLSLTTLLVSLFSFSSCKKSYRCCYDGDCYTVRESDFSSPQEFRSYINYLKSEGYTCL
ncbi:MAG: hypothetical protein JST49_02315 [Bacteroidetes bacterium]|nr:hypothetical protein [Bacteroidota bacterium]